MNKRYDAQELKRISVKKNRQTLRQRPIPEGIRELVYLINQLPEELRRPHREGTGISAYPDTLVLEAERLGIGAHSLRVAIAELVKQLPLDIQTFIKVNDLEETRMLIRMLPSHYQSAIREESLESINESIEALRVEEDKAGIDGMNWPDPRFEQAKRARQRYIYLIVAQELLRCVARRVPLLNATLHRYSEDVQIRPYVDKEGKLAMTTPPLYATLTGVEVERVRECPICNNIFWAGRLDQKGCSTRCSQVLRSRHWRTNYYERYKQQRTKLAEERDRAALPERSATVRKRSGTVTESTNRRRGKR